MRKSEKEEEGASTKLCYGGGRRCKTKGTKRDREKERVVGKETNQRLRKNVRWRERGMYDCRMRRNVKCKTKMKTMH